MSLDRGLAVAGALLSLPGFMLLFFTDHQTTAILAVFIGLGILVSARTVQYLTNLPPFTMKSVAVVLTFKDDHGKHAVLSKHYVIRPNFNNLGEMAHRNIASDGAVSNICWNDEPVPAADIRTVLGEYEVTVRFRNQQPRKWHLFQGKLSYMLTDSFNGNEEGLMYVVDFPARAVSFRVDLPAKRRCRSATAYRLEGSGRTALQPPLISGDGATISLTVKRPRVGSEFAIYWRW